jgi:hypothetical protein
MTPTVGKADKYYTLWEVSDWSNRADLWTDSGHQYQYRQNLSYDYDTALKKVKEQFGSNFDIDLDLRGRSSFTKSLKRTYNPGIFLFGKYKGQSFTSVEDYGWAEWYWNATKNTEKEDTTLQDFLIKIGMLFKLSDDTVLNRKELDRHIQSTFSTEYYKLGHFGTDGDRVGLELRVRNQWGYQSSFGWVDVIEMIHPHTLDLYYVRGSYQTKVDFDNNDYIFITGTISHKQWYDNNLDGIRLETQLKRPVISDKFS